MKRSLLLFFLPFFVFTFIFYAISENACNYVMANHPQVPLPFNHKNHITKYEAAGEKGDSCDSICHTYYENGRFKGIPSVGVCKQCHDGNTAAEKAFFNTFKDSDVPWGSYAKQPDLVYFSHTAVMKNTKEAICSSCHGDKANSMTVARTERTRGKMPMGQCMDCHNSLRISNACQVCHD